jgi:hypothetical protein
MSNNYLSKLKLALAEYNIFHTLSEIEMQKSVVLWTTHLLLQYSFSADMFVTGILVSDHKVQEVGL